MFSTNCVAGSFKTFYDVIASAKGRIRPVAKANEVSEAISLSNSHSQIRCLKRVVITGLGMVTPYGIGKEPYWEGLRSSRSAVRRITLFPTEGLGSRVAAEVPDFNPLDFISPRELKRLPRVAVMAIAAAREALGDSGLDPETMSEAARLETGVILGTGGGGIAYAEEQYRLYFSQGIQKCHPFSVSSAFVGMLSSEVSIAFKLRGPSHVVSTGCTSSTDAIGYAFQQIRTGSIQRVVTGGADCCITPGIVASYSMMKVVSQKWNGTPERASRPFDRQRDGFVIGEGAWLFVLEELESALERGAPIYGEILGYASTCDAYHRVQIMPEGIESARALTLALEDAGLPPESVDYVNLHGTSTLLNDKTETRALRLAFGDFAEQLPMSATKSLIGHPQGASGAAGLAATLFSIKENYLHPTINYEEPDPECDLDYIPNEGRRREVQVAMVNTIAFGSKNSSVVVGKFA